MKVTLGMSCSINGIISSESGNEDFLPSINWDIMLGFLEQNDCIVWGNTTFKNTLSWGEHYIDDLKSKTIIVFSKKDKDYPQENVIYCNSLDEFNQICKENNFNNVLVYGGAHINTLFLKNHMVDEVIISYNPYILNKGINLFEGDYFEQKLSLYKIEKEPEDIVQLWYKVKK